MKIYKENIERWRFLFSSEYFKSLERINSIDRYKVMWSLYVDADAYDDELYKELGEKYKLNYRKNYLIDKDVNDNEIRLSSDVICGFSQIFTYCNENLEMFLDEYKNVRSNLNLHFIWPKHKAPTINTLRYAKYKDRIDCLIYDIKEYFDGKETPMKQAYENENTNLWLSKFNNDFKYFIDTMKLNSFVDENYDVLDIATNQKEIINEAFDLVKVNKSLKDYMSNMLSLSKARKL